VCTVFQEQQQENEEENVQQQDDRADSGTVDEW